MTSSLPADPLGSTPKVGAVKADDDFLYHLYRGVDMLMRDRVGEAKEELERAILLQPPDPRSEDLLAGVYFRLGIYERSIEIWQRLVRTHADKVPLHINLALALFKVGKPEQALHYIEHALRLQPDHERAWGYLGLIAWRLGDFPKARDAFLRGGQVSMAKRMSDAMGDERSLSPEGVAEDLPGGSAIRVALEGALKHLEHDPAALLLESAEKAPKEGSWRMLAPGEEWVPRASRPRTSRALSPTSATLGSLLDSWGTAPAEGRCFALTGNHELLVDVPSGGRANSRIGHLCCVAGKLQAQPLFRRHGPVEEEGALGGAQGLLQIEGAFRALLAAPQGKRFLLLPLAGEVLYLREEHLWAFEESVRYESGSLESEEGSTKLTHLYGSGLVVLCVERLPTAFEIDASQEIHVHLPSLLGWVGRLLPSNSAGRGEALGMSSLVLQGQGTLLLA